MIRRLFRNDNFWAILVSLLLITLAYIPIVYNYQNPPLGRIYLGFNDYPMDYLGNLAMAEQGNVGHWMRQTIMSSILPAKPTFLRMEYITIGHIAHRLNIPVLVTFKISVLVLSVLYLYILWNIVKRIFSIKYQRILAYFLILFSTGIILPENMSFPGFIFGWDKIRQDMQVFQRTTILQQHYMLGAMFSIPSLYLLSLTFQKRNIKLFIFAAILAFLAAQEFMPAMLVIFGALGIYILFIYIRDRGLINVFRIIPQVFAYFTFAVPPILYQWYLSHFYEWNTFPRAERMFSIHLTPVDYIFMVGLIFIPAISTIPQILRGKNIFLQLCATWILAHMIEFFVVDKVVAMNPWRFVNTPFFVFYGIIGSYGLFNIRKYLSNHLSVHIANGFMIMSIIIIIGSSYITYWYSFNYNLERTWYEIPIGYPKSEDYEAFKWLSLYGKKEVNVLSSSDTAMLVLGLTSNYVYISRWGEAHLDSYFDILDPLLIFYRNWYSDEAGCNFLHSTKMTYVFFGEMEQEILITGGNDKSLKYSCLSPVYQNQATIIYKVY
jgi:hypothetical protein